MEEEIYKNVCLVARMNCVFLGKGELLTRKADATLKLERLVAHSFFICAVCVCSGLFITRLTSCSSVLKGNARS